MSSSSDLIKNRQDLLDSFNKNKEIEDFINFIDCKITNVLSKDSYMSENCFIMDFSELDHNQLEIILKDSFVYGVHKSISFRDTFKQKSKDTICITTTNTCVKFSWA